MAFIVMVTVPAGAMDPFQVTVRVAGVATAVPEVTVAETSAKVAGRTSLNSLPVLSPCVPAPVFVRVIVYATLPPGTKVPATVLVALTFAPGVGDGVGVGVAATADD